MITYILLGIILFLQIFFLIFMIRFILGVPKLIDFFIREKIKEFTTQENIEKIKPMAKKFAIDIFQEAAREMMPKESQGEIILPGQEGNPLMGMGLNFLPKKWRGLASLAMMFMGKKGNGGNSPPNNPFG